MQHQPTLQDFTELKRKSLELGLNDLDADFVALNCWIDMHIRANFPESLMQPITPQICANKIQNKEIKSALLMGTIFESYINAHKRSEGGDPLFAAETAGIKANDILKTTVEDLFAKKM